MAKYLVIVESPAKVKTIKKFLGANYEVMASNGHVRDFPKSQFGIDVDHDYEPKYITIRGKGEILAKLRKEAKKADKVYLATDPDREGEAISWHLSKALGLEDKKMYRITFNEITKTAVKESLKHARQIDMDLVDAQQARRMVDRMVGYRISPLLWAKVKRGLSAGRVQSAALRIIADREEEINAFVPEEYWSLDAQFKVTGEKKPVTAKFYGTTKEKMEIHSREEMDQVLAALKDAAFSVTDVKKGDFFQINPGCLHAIKGGTVILETQQNSDITYRVYDYDRLQDGKPRALHVQQSIDVIKAPFEPAVAEHEKLDVEGAEAEKLVSCPCYTVCKATVNGTAEFDWNQPFVDISVLDGEGSFDGTPVKKGTHLIVPACYGKMKAEGKNLMMIYSYITEK